MARLFLRGAALLSCVLLLYGDPVCDVTILKYAASDAKKIVLHCSVIGNVTSVSWTCGGTGIPLTQQQPNSQILEIPLEEAIGLYECNVQCNLGVSRSASIKLDIPGQKAAEISRGMNIVIGFGVLFLIMIILNVGCYYRRLFRRRRRARLSRMSTRRDPASDQGTNGHPMMLTDLPNVVTV